MTLLLDVTLRSSVVLGAGLLLTSALTNRSAALRHRVLVAALLASIVVMPASLTLPGWSVPLPSFDRLQPVAPPPDAGVTVATADASVAPAPDRFSPIVIAWAAGVLASSLALIVGLARVRRAAAGATRVDDASWVGILDEIASRYGLRRRIAIARTESDDLLATWGVLEPQVLLPRHARDWEPDRVRVVLGHELAHIRRRDWIVQMAAEALRAVLWFNPLIWMVCTRLRVESEKACDDEVLGLGVGGTSYAAHLLELAKACRRPRSGWAPAVPMAHPSTLERRITAMLNPRLDRQMPSRRAMAGLVLAVTLVAVPAAAVRARQSGPAQLGGTIFDATGAVLPGVRVTVLTDQGTFTATSNAGGRFELPVIAPGKYVLEVTQPGFRALRQDLVLREARDWERNITLQVGELAETVNVRESRAGTAPPAAGAQVRVGGTIRPPVKIRDVRPIYPPSMRDAGLTGVVPMEAVIGNDGSVVTVRVLSAQVHPDFAIAAVDAVRQWRFRPTLLNGAPVEVTMTVTVRFDLED